jgi:hypothetical protein
MRWVAALALLAMVVGCSHDRYPPMGDAAPAFGSTPELSTLQGFAVGTWCEAADPSVRTKTGSMVEDLLRFDHSLITLGKDGKASLERSRTPGVMGHGTWNVVGNQIVVTFTDVDGLSFDEINAQLDRRRTANVQVRRVEGLVRPGPVFVGEGIEGDRAHVMSSCQNFKSLVVGKDGKRLELAQDVDSPPMPNIGKMIWLRVK